MDNPQGLPIVHPYRTEQQANIPGLLTYADDIVIGTGLPAHLPQPTGPATATTSAHLPQPTGSAATSRASSPSQPPSLESMQSTAPTTFEANQRPVSRAWLTVGLTRVVLELRTLFLQTFLETRLVHQNSHSSNTWHAVIQAIIGTALFPSVERFEAAWQFAFQQSPYSHIWELIDMELAEVQAMLAAVAKDD